MQKIEAAPALESLDLLRAAHCVLFAASSGFAAEISMKDEVSEDRTSSRATPAGEADDSLVSGLRQRLAFLELSGDDQQRLREVADALQSSNSQFIETFYQHLLSFADTARFLRDSEFIARLKQLQEAHLESMLAARWDEAYAQQRRRVGNAHARLGIDPQMFVGAYNQYLQYALRELMGDDAMQRDRVEQLSSLLKVVLLDIGMTLDAYFAEATQRVHQALEMVFQANAELKRFAHLTSHDLKTPLGTVANLCEEALDEFSAKMPNEAKQLIEAARNRTYRMGTLIDELLASTITPLDSRRQEVVVTQEIVAEIVDELRPQLRQKNIELAIAANLPNVRGERVRIREALFNIFSNAIKFMDKDHGRIVIDADTSERECTISIADNGPGIPKEEFGRIFVPFVRLGEPAGAAGSGLGLYFTQSMIEEQGGRVWVESELGEGCRFFLALPCA